MRIMMVHNRYQYRGGEDIVVDNQIDLLRANGHEVKRIDVENDSSNYLKTGKALLGTPWSPSTYKQIFRESESFKPQIAHIHNTWYQLSLSAVSAYKKLGVPVIMTLHNYRFLCVGTNFIRQGKTCTDCLGMGPWLGIKRKCYRNSYGLSALSASALLAMKYRVANQIDLFHVPSQWTKEMYTNGGFPGERIVVRPHFLKEKEKRQDGIQPNSSPMALFLGRFSEEKGLDLLLNAWQQVEEETNATLILAGEGALREQLQQQATENGLHQVQFLPYQQGEDLENLFARSTLIIQPSQCYETFGLTLAEAYMRGKPVIATDIGAQSELVQHGKTGLLCKAGSEKELAQTLITLLSDQNKSKQMGQTGYNIYKERFSPERYYETLISDYTQLIEHQGN